MLEKNGIINSARKHDEWLHHMGHPNVNVFNLFDG
jgi:hypothetical protein